MLLFTFFFIKRTFEWIIYLQKFNIMAPCQFCRHCLQNWVGQVHFPHFINIAQAESAAIRKLSCAFSCNDSVPIYFLEVSLRDIAGNGAKIQLVIPKIR